MVICEYNFAKNYLMSDSLLLKLFRKLKDAKEK